LDRIEVTCFSTALADDEPVRHRLVRAALGDQAKDRALARGQLVQP
jgi:hypothetical protein